MTDIILFLNNFTYVTLYKTYAIQMNMQDSATKRGLKKSTEKNNVSAHKCNSSTASL